MPQTFIIAEDRERVTRLTINPIQELSGYPLHADRSMREEDLLWILHRRVGLILYNLNTRKLTLAPWKVSPCFQRCRSLKSGMWASRSNVLYHVWQADGHPMRQEVCQMPDSSEIRCIYDDGAGTLYVATSRHVYAYSIVSSRLKAITSIDAPPIAITLSGGHLSWIADGQVYSLTLPTNQENKPHLPVLLQGVEQASDLACGDDGKVWKLRKTARCIACSRLQVL